jgi:hypothetical protein
MEYRERHYQVAGGGLWCEWREDTELRGKPETGELAGTYIFRSQVSADRVSVTGYQVRVRGRVMMCKSANAAGPRAKVQMLETSKHSLNLHLMLNA